MHSSLRVAVIGAGCSGITAIKNLLQVGLQEVICYEQNDDVGGNWIYSTEPGHSSVCETTHIISSKSLSAYRDFPMPDHYPDYPSHAQVLAYFREYARHFGLYPYLRFGVRVLDASQLADQRWQLTLSDGSTDTVDYLLVANGHHHVPRHPADIRDQFKGRYLHSHDYKHNRDFVDQRVLVIGGGNSACDCAVEVSRVAEHVAISMRRPHYIVPKFFLGRPTDTFNQLISWLPRPLAEALQRLSLRIQVGRYRQYGLEQPTEAVTRSHPTLNSELLYRIRHGKVTPRRGITQIQGKEVTFTDGQVDSYDTVIAATGYQITFPFLDAEVTNFSSAQRIPLYLRMFHPQYRNLIFIGLFQPQGAIWPLADYQAALAANYITGRWQWPADMAERAERDSDYIAREFSDSYRHLIEVHYHPFLRRLSQQLPADAPAWPTAVEAAAD